MASTKKENPHSPSLALPSTHLSYPCPSALSQMLMLHHKRICASTVYAHPSVPEGRRVLYGQASRIRDQC